MDNDYHQITRQTYDRIADDWMKDHHDDTWWVEGTNKFISLLKPGSTILDVGCGAGEKSKYLISKGFNVWGVDFSEKMIELAKRDVPKGNFFTMDMRDLGALESRFSAVFAQAALLHIPKKEIQDVLEKLKNKLELGGYLYIAVKEIKSEGVEEEVRIENDYGYEYSRFFSYFSVDELKSYFQNVGMNVVYENSVKVSKTTWLQVIAQGPFSNS